MGTSDVRGCAAAAATTALGIAVIALASSAANGFSFFGFLIASSIGWAGILTVSLQARDRITDGAARRVVLVTGILCAVAQLGVFALAGWNLGYDASPGFMTN